MINQHYHRDSSSSNCSSPAPNSLPPFPKLASSSLSLSLSQPDLPTSSSPSVSQPQIVHKIIPLSHKPIPPPLSIINQLSSDHDLPISEDIMTARCSQFPPIDPLQPPSASMPSSRFQPYLSALSTDKASWNQFNSNHARLHALPSSPSFALEDSPISSTDLNSSSSSLPSSTKHHSSFGPTSAPHAIRFTDSPPPSSCPDQLYPPLPPAPYAQTPNYPVYTGPTQQPSLGLAYPAAAFTPSGGSPPITSPTSLNSSSFFHLEPAAGRRHTVSAYVSPSPIELGLVGCADLDESYMKEEKRRRNKESSQRFRDRTRERQREKQERLEYLERRTKELESELRMRVRAESRPDGLGAPSPGPSREHDLVERLQAENKGLRSALKGAEEEINRLRQLAGVQSPQSPFSVGQVYASLAQLSPPASGVGSGSQASSPAAEASYFGTRGTSPASDTPSTHHRLGATGPTGMGYPVAEHHSQAAYHAHQMAAGQREFWEHATVTANANVNPTVNGNANVNPNEGAVAGWQAPEQQNSLVLDQQQ